MLRKLAKAVLCALVFGATAIDAASVDSAAPALVVDALPAEVQGWVDVVSASGATPALGVAIVRSGQPNLLFTAGETYSGSGQVVDVHTVFRLASVSKGFAATLCGLLADAGFLSLQQSVVDLVPGLQLADPNAATALTLERLLSHQTWLPHHTFDMKLEANAPLIDLIQSLPCPACRRPVPSAAVTLITSCFSTSPPKRRLAPSAASSRSNSRVGYWCRWK